MRPHPRAQSSATQPRRSAAAALLTLASLLLLVGFLGLDLLGRQAQALLVCVVPVLLILLSTARSSSRRLLGAMVGLWVLLGGSWSVLIWLDGAGVPRLAGVPLVVWILMLGLVLLPLGLVSWAYATTFDRGEAERDDRSAESGNRSESG